MDEKMEDKRIMGYSERGIINALIMDIAVAKSKNDGSDIELLHFLRDILLGENISENSEYKKEYNFNNYQIYIEPSFSDFGDSDLLILLLKDDSFVQAFFIEAKISGCGKKYEISKHYNDLIRKINVNEKIYSSNLFIQLYHKFKLFSNPKRNKDLKAGIEFPDFSTKKIRKIGENDIVLKLYDQINSLLPSNLEDRNKVDNLHFIALIPGTKESNTFDKNKDLLLQLDTKKLYQQEIEFILDKIKICYFHEILDKSKESLKNFNATYEFNKKQIEGKYFD